MNEIFFVLLWKIKGKDFILSVSGHEIRGVKLKY